MNMSAAERTSHAEFSSAWALFAIQMSLPRNFAHVTLPLAHFADFR